MTEPVGTTTVRVLLALEALQASPGITAERLAARLGVSDRAARRYVSMLREAGIPVDSERGRYGGYRLGRGLRLPPLTFAADEALGLVMAVLDGHHDPEDRGHPVGRALAALLRALPEPVAAQAEAVRRTASAAPDRGAARPDPATTAVLVQACADGRGVRLDYRSEAGSRWDADVDPWAVVVRHGRWYLLCRDHRRDEPRAYRVDRVGAVELLDTRFSVPADLDAVAVLEEHLAVGWEYDVEVLLPAGPEEAARHLPASLGRLEELPDGTARLRGSTSNPWWYAARLAAVPTPFRVAGGPELRHAVRTLGERLVTAADDAPS